MKRQEVIDNARIQTGDVIVGTGQLWPSHVRGWYNAGMGSNGLTSARHDVFHNELGHRFPRDLRPRYARATWFIAAKRN